MNMPKVKRSSRTETKQTKAMVVSLSPKKKSRASLKPPAPNAFTQLDTWPRLHVKISASGYGTAIATKGLVTADKAYFRPAEQQISNTKDQTLIKTLSIYGLVKLRISGTNNAKQQYWKTFNGDNKSCDWKVSSNYSVKNKYK